MCGEQGVLHSLGSPSLGSPPRVRGTARAAGSQAQGHRITPACAGNSFRRQISRESSQDHPRVCGEQWPRSCKTRPGLGSPPRVRGTVYPVADAAPRFPITPACAGNSPKNSKGESPAEDHPRVCGEQRWICTPPEVRSGSPPRVRGTEDPF